MGLPVAIVGSGIVSGSVVGPMQLPLPAQPTPLLQSDFNGRIAALLPPHWWREDAKQQGNVLYALLQGVALELANVHALYRTLYAWTRIRTSTGGQVDAIALDFFNGKVARKPDEADSAFVARILLEVLLAKGTRPGIAQGLSALAGDPYPVMFEPWNPQDTKGYGSTYAGFGAPICCWGASLRDASSSPAFEGWIWVKRPLRTISNALGIAGLSTPQASYGVAHTMYLAQQTEFVLIVDADILDFIARTHAYGTAVGVNPY